MHVFPSLLMRECSTCITLFSIPLEHYSTVAPGSSILSFPLVFTPYNLFHFGLSLHLCLHFEVLRSAWLYLARDNLPLVVTLLPLAYSDG